MSSMAARTASLTCLLVSSMVGRAIRAEEPDVPGAAEEFSFDVDEFEKSPWSLDGYMQGNLSYADVNRGASAYRLSNLGMDREDDRFGGGSELQMGLTYQRGPLKAYSLGMAAESYARQDWDSDAVLYEGSLSLQVGRNAYFTLGKSLLRWGKGYAWNPTNFVGRDKNPSDPELVLEGYWLGLAEYVKSFYGPLKTLALTGAILPVSEHVNPDFSREEDLNAAGKLYLLLYDTDIDIMALLEGNRPASYGLTMSRNLTINLEIHGELALKTGGVRQVVDAGGMVTTEEEDAWSYLAGIRYLAPTDTTFIIEYYHNGKGYSKSEASHFFGFVDQADEALLAASRPALSRYQRPHCMQNYLYLKASQKEPFSLLYVTPSLFTILNLDDGSLNLGPEVAYTGIKNLELSLRVNVRSGGAHSEYGEKASNWGAELRLRYFF